MANQIIPDTESVEVALIAAALHLIGALSGDIDDNLRRFAEAYRVVSEVRSTKGHANVEKILKELREAK